MLCIFLIYQIAKVEEGEERPVQGTVIYDLAHPLTRHHHSTFVGSCE